LTLDAYVRARGGDFHGAANSLRDGLVIAQSLETNPLAMSQLVRMATHRHLLHDLKRFLPHFDFDSADLARLQAELEAIDIRPGMRLGLLGDRVAGIVSADDPSTMDYNSRVDGRLLTLVHHATRQRLTMGFLEAMEKMIEIVDQPWPDVIDQTQDAKLPRYTPRSTFNFDLLPEFLGHLEQYVRQGARTTAGNQVGTLAVALARYRREHGGFPSRLDELVPDYLTELPIDATSDQPFVYTLDEHGVLLRSSWHDSNSKIDTETGADDDLLFRWPADGQ
jgi:hypothetical protein